MMPSDDVILQHIQQAFEENFEVLRLEGGHSLAPEVKQLALEQVLIYWHKLRDVATRITDTEVRLVLPDQTTPSGRRFGIEGVVDIVRDDDRVVMYDIKTHPVEAITANRGQYEDQLDIYAYIWQRLRGHRLDQAAVISTVFPDVVKTALREGPPERLDHALAGWDPVVPIPFDPDHVAALIHDFGCLVDHIEDGAFAPPPVTRLAERVPGGSRFGRDRLFANVFCDDCDARFSCAAYRAYAETATSARAAAFRQYFTDHLVFTDAERDAWIAAAIDDLPDPDDVL